MAHSRKPNSGSYPARQPHLTTTRTKVRSCRPAAIAMLFAATSAIAISPSARAQISGTINARAPRVTTTVELGDGSKLELRYTALHYGEGKWRTISEDASERAAFNAMAQRKPVASVSTTAHVVASGNLVPPGRYDLYFTINRDQCWELNLHRQDGEALIPINWHMHAKATRKLHRRLRLGLEPAKETNAAIFRFAFGTQVLTVPLELRDGKDPYRKPANAEENESNSRAKPPKGSKPPDGKSPSGNAIPGRRTQRSPTHKLRELRTRLR